MRLLSPCTKAMERIVACSEGARFRHANGTSEAELILVRLRYRSLM